MQLPGKVVEANQVGAFNVERLAAEKMALHGPVTVLSLGYKGSE